MLVFYKIMEKHEFRMLMCGKNVKETRFFLAVQATKDAERPGRPIEVTFQEMINKIPDMVLGDRRLKIHAISEIGKISIKLVFLTLHEYLYIRKLS